MQHLDPHTITHTQRPFQTAALRDALRPTNTPKKQYTETHIKIITVTLPEDVPPSSSLSPHDPSSLQWPIAHGIIPGSLHASHSPPTSSSAPGVETIGTTAAPSQPRGFTSTLRCSTYPRPSPPGFLYPEAIVPRAAYENAMQHPEAIRDMENAIWYLPYGLEVLIFTVMFLGFAWAILVMLVNFPPRTWSFILPTQTRNKHWVEKKSWWIRLMMWRPWNEDGNRKTERRPLDKPSKYAALPGISERPASEENVAITSSADTPRIYIHENKHLDSIFQQEEGIELARRPQHRNQTFTQHRRGSSSPATAIRFSIASAPSSPVTSSPNPFLCPPNTHLSPPINLPSRSSSEWLAEHAAFFQTSSLPPLSPSHSSTSSITDPDEYAAMNTADIEALEAGTAPLTPRTAAKKADMKGSWVDLGLGRVEDAVNGFVGRMARWTDDDKGRVGEGMVLPVAEEGRRIKVE